MKITYRFLDNTISEVEVSEEIGSFIVASRREEASLERKERRHCYSLDAITYEGNEYGTPDFTEALFDDTTDRIHEAFQYLTLTQRRRIRRLAAWRRISLVAAAEHKNYASVYESIQSARKKFLENYRNTPHKTAPGMSVCRGGKQLVPQKGENEDE